MVSKKTTSVFLAVVIIFTAVCGMFMLTANAETAITYSLIVKTSETVNGFEGELNYSDTLSVNSITFSGQKNIINGKILFNDSNVSDGFAFTNGANLITVVFNVLGDYNASDISCEISEFYSSALVMQGNIPFDYESVIDGEVVSRGHTDIDTPANSYVDTKYSVVYSYEERPEIAATYTKTVWGHSDASQIAELGMPGIRNPYFDNYSVENATFSGKTINARLSCETRKFDVSLNGTKIGEYSYLQIASVSADNESDFLIDGIHMARGTSYSFFVTGDMDITAVASSGTITESAFVVNNALYLSDSPNGVNLKMEILASVTSTDFSRMGVAYAAYPKTEADIKAAVNTVESGAGVCNKIAVHNSAVDHPNVSGQYQFIFAPYVLLSKVNKDKSLYFYSYVVNEDGSITVSSVSQVKFANILA